MRLRSLAIWLRNVGRIGPRLRSRYLGALLSRRLCARPLSLPRPAEGEGRPAPERRIGGAGGYLLRLLGPLAARARAQGGQGEKTAAELSGEELQRRFPLAAYLGATAQWRERSMEWAQAIRADLEPALRCSRISAGPRLELEPEKPPLLVLHARPESLPASRPAEGGEPERGFLGARVPPELLLLVESLRRRGEPRIRSALRGADRAAHRPPAESAGSARSR